MPRADLAVQQIKAITGAPAADSLDLLLTAADTTNLNSATFSGREVLIAQNSGASPYTVTLSSAPDSKLGRTGDVATYSLAASEIAIFYPGQAEGWRQSADGKLYFQASNIAVKFAVIKLPDA